MTSRELYKRLLVFIILVGCSQQILADTVVKASKSNNNSTTNTQANYSAKPLRVLHKIKATTTRRTTTTISNPEPKSTNVIGELDIDARNSFINNHFVAVEGGSTSYTPKGFRENISSLIIIDPVRNHVEAENLPNKPKLNSEMSQFEDYEEEEMGESDYVPENCEDTAESLTDNEGQGSTDGYTHKQDTFDNLAFNIFEQTVQNKSYDSSKYGTQTNIYPLPSHGYKEQLYYGQEKKQKPIKQYHINQQNPQPLSNYLKPEQKAEVAPKSGTKLNYTEVGNSYYNNSALQNYSNYYPALLSSYGNSNSLSSSIIPNISHANSNEDLYVSSPFSSISTYKKFKTVSSSIQYVSTPLVDLVFKYSIGVVNSKIPKNPSDKKVN